MAFTYTEILVKNVLEADATSAALTFNLPVASERKGTVYLIFKTDSSTNRVTILPSGSDTINGDTDYVLGLQNEGVALLSNGTTWRIVGRF